MGHKEVKVDGLIRKITRLANQIGSQDEGEERVLQAALAEEGGGELRSVRLSLAECHVIDCIGRRAPINTTAIAGKLKMTKGGISKITAKLVAKQLAEVERLANNQKETYYRLTPLGDEVFRVHARLHERAEARFGVRFAAYSPAELQAADKFLDDLLAEFQSVGSEGEKP